MSGYTNSYNAINLAGLPLPNVLEPLDFETEVARIRAELSAKFADDHPIQAALSLESEPINKIIEVLAYRYVLKIAEINRKARSLMLAFATGSDLDHLGVTYYRLERKLLQAEDKTAIPPKPAIYESDDDYRYRLALSVEAMTMAGSAGSYEFHALSASAEVHSVTVHSPAPTEVDVYLAGQIDGDVLVQTNKTVGVSAQAVTDVYNALVADDVRPLTDLVRVNSATAKAYRIDAVVYVKNGISPQLILSQGMTALRQYLTDNFKPNARVATSRIIGALDVMGVSRIELNEPKTDVMTAIGEVAHCTDYNIIAKSEGT